MTQEESVGLQLHQSGRVAEAETVYRQILARNPHNADILHLLGILMHQTGRTSEGIPLVDRALAIRQDSTFLGNLAELLRAAGQHERGIACCHQAIRLTPNLAVAYQNLAALLDDVGKLNEACAAAQEGVRLAPNDAPAHRILGAVLTKLGRLPEATAELETSIRLNPNDAAGWAQLGICYEANHRYPQAIECHRRAVQITPNFAPRVYQLGRVLLRRARPAEALPFFDRVTQLGGLGSQVHMERARCLELLNRFDEAIAICNAVIATEPTNVPAHATIANTRIQAAKAVEAEVGLREAMKLVTAPDFHQILAVSLTRQGRLEEALKEVERAIEIHPTWTEANFSKALILLFAGRFQEAWPYLEWRWKHPEMDGWRHPTDKPIWDGSPLNGKRILIYAEQGFGDTIQFVRYIKMVAERGGVVTLEVQRGLSDLMRGVAGVDRAIYRGEPVGAFDAHAPLLSLPGIFKTSLETIPADVPYVFATPAKIEQWRQFIGHADGKIKIGICWTGGPFQRENHQRSTLLANFAPISAVGGARFYSLQKGPSASQALQPPAGMDLVNLDPLIQDFSDTAGIMANLDLIISVDTAVVHLAGAMGKPIWTLLGRNLGHNWMIDREDSPWYPTMRLFRQPTLGQWEPVMARVAEELKEFIGLRNRGA